MFLIVGPTSLVGQLQRLSSHPIQELLRSYAGAHPPEASIRTVAESQPGALAAVEELLVTGGEQDLWSAAVESLGIITTSKDAQDVNEKLSSFLHSSNPFGCLKTPCKSLETDEDTQDRDREARLEVPVALGYVLRNVRSAISPLTVNRAQALETNILFTLEQVAKIPYKQLRAPWCSDASGQIEESCGVELQVNAVRGLGIAGSPLAIQSLKRIRDQSTSSLVISAAKAALPQ
jgi:hypothetical protein